MMEKDYIQELFDELAALLPANWEQAVLHGAVAPGTSTIFFYTKVAQSPVWYSYLDLQEKGVYTAEEYKKARIRMGRISISWLASCKDRPWTGYTLSISRTGDFSVDYEYGEQEVGIPAGFAENYLN